MIGTSPLAAYGYRVRFDGVSVPPARSPRPASSIDTFSTRALASASSNNK